MTRRDGRLGERATPQTRLTRLCAAILGPVTRAQAPRRSQGVPRQRLVRDSAASVTNWCGTHELASSPPAEPRTEREVQALLASHSAPARIQILGSRHSWPDLIRSHGALPLSMERLSGIRRIGADFIEVAGGTSLQDVYRALRAADRRLDCSPPVIATQTVAGAMATGTHGQGLRQSALGDVARSVRFIDAHGVAAEIGESDPDFGAFRLHLGCLGVLTRVTLGTVPNTVFTCEKRSVDYAEFISRFHAWNEEYAYCKAWWFPEHEKVHLWLTREATADEREAYEANGGRPVHWSGRDPGMNEAVETAIGRMQIDTKTRDLRQKHYKTLLRFKDFSNITGDIADILCKGIPVAQINCEIGVPLAAMLKVQEELRHWHQCSRHRLHYPVIIRATGRSKAWLSPSYRQATCYYGFVVYRAKDGSFAESAFQGLKEIQDVLVGAGGLPHWGKFFSPGLFDFDGLERWEDFKRVRRMHDPDERFLNGLLAPLLGAGTTRQRSRDSAAL